LTRKRKAFLAVSSAHSLLAVACAAAALASAGTASAEAPPADAEHAHHRSQMEDTHAAHAAHTTGFAPIGVMGEHMHPAGGFMVSYRYESMRMEGNRDGSNRVDEDEILLPSGRYMVSPRDMDMQMHMFGAMYAPTDWLTLTAMIPYIRLRMDHAMASGGRFTTRSDGPGDLILGGLWKLFESGGHHVHLNTGVRFPTGGISHEDQVPVPMLGFANRRLPYPMQIGSGTWDLLPGATYTGKTAWLAWGAQAMGTVRLGHNRHGYRLGNRADATAWVDLPLLDWLDLSGRLAYAYWGNINNADDSLNPGAVPTADPDKRAGHRIDLLGGVSFMLPAGWWGHHRLGIEAGAPVYQWLDGPQLETDWRVTAGWQLFF
jgi:hypothetical protein